MAFEILDNQYRHDELKNRMQGDLDGINTLKNRLQASVNLHAEISADLAMIPWYQDLTQAEKDKLLAWKNDCQELLDKIILPAPEGLGF